VADPGLPDKVRANRRIVPVELTDMGWPVYPDGLTTHLRRLADDYGFERIYITENGAAYRDVVDPDGAVRDPDRISYLARHFEAASEAMHAGVPLAGYFVWSLMDNFEWALGYSKRFGLVYVDYPTGRRIPKASYQWLRGQVSA
jgi:beta-glucosidase